MKKDQQLMAMSLGYVPRPSPVEDRSDPRHPLNPAMSGTEYDAEAVAHRLDQITKELHEVYNAAKWSGDALGRKAWGLVLNAAQREIDVLRGLE